MALLRRFAAVALVSVGAWGLGSASTSPAFAATPAEIAQLHAQPCPFYDVGREQSYSTGQVARAKDGTFEVMAGKPAQLVPPVDWTQDPYASRSWGHYLHGFSWVDPLLYAYAHDGDVDALTQARDLLLDWIAAVPREPGAPEQSWLDKTVGDRSRYLGYITRAAACEDLLDDAQAATLIDSVREHGSLLADPGFHAPTNHGLYDNFGLALLGRNASFLAEGPAWVELARQRFRSTLSARLYEEEGFWLEHSAGYQFLVIRLVERFAERFDPGAYDGELAVMREAAGWLVMPPGTKVPYGDSGSGLAPEWAREEATDDRGLRVMRRSGLAVVKDRGGYLLVTAGFHNRTHKHADDLGFHLYDRGRDVISDTGHHNYNLDRWRRFSLSAAAHSVLSVGNHDFPIKADKRVYGSGIRAAGAGHGWYAIQGANPLLRPRGVRHRRLYLYRPGRALVVIDFVRAKRERPYLRRLQLAPQLDVRRHRGRLRLAAEGFRGALRDGGAPARLRVIEGRDDPPGGWSLTGGGRTARPTVQLRSRAEDARYVAALGLRGPASARLLPSPAGSVKVRVGGPALRDSVLRVKRRRGGLSIAERRAG